MPKKARELSPIDVKRRSKKEGFWPVGGVTGLHLLVSETLAASWILRAMLGGKRPELGLGPYPEVGVALAREKAAAAREQIRNGIDPREAKKAAAAALRSSQAKALTFDEAATLAHKTKAPEFSNGKHVDDWLASLTRYASPLIGALPVASIEVAHVVAVLKPIWTTKTETATRVRQRIETVLAWATVQRVSHGRQSGAVERATRVRIAEAVESPQGRASRGAQRGQDVPAFMAQLRTRDGMGARALEFAILTAARSGEIRLATWDEIDLDAKLLDGAGGAHEGAQGASRAVERRSDRAAQITAAIRGLAVPVSGGARWRVVRHVDLCRLPAHGDRRRATRFSVELQGLVRAARPGYADEVSELALAHVNSDQIARGRMRAIELLPKRAKLMRDWAKFCATVPTKADVTPIRGRSRG